jgi:hypothetical protein
VTPGATALGDPYSSGVNVVTIGHFLDAVGDSFLAAPPGFGMYVGPTGRLRHTDHDGLRDVASGARGSAFEVDEASVFANASYDLPGTTFGGHLRIAGLAGYGYLTQDFDIPGNWQTDVDMAVFGGSALWNSGSFYTLSQIIGLHGEADAQSPDGPYSYDVAGYFTNSVIGNTFDLAGAWKFDLRGGIGHYDVATDHFALAGGGTVKAGAEAWTGTLTGTLFTLTEVGGGTLRPYLLAAYKTAFDEDIDVRGDAAQSLEQATDYGRAELGFDYVEGAMSYGAAGYGEFSADETTFGLRLGASVKLQ